MSKRPKVVLHTRGSALIKIQKIGAEFVRFGAPNGWEEQILDYCLSEVAIANIDRTIIKEAIDSLGLPVVDACDMPVEEEDDQ